MYIIKLPLLWHFCVCMGYEVPRSDVSRSGSRSGDIAWSVCMQNHLIWCLPDLECLNRKMPDLEPQIRWIFAVLGGFCPLCRYISIILLCTVPYICLHDIIYACLFNVPNSRSYYSTTSCIEPWVQVDLTCFMHITCTSCSVDTSSIPPYSLHHASTVMSSTEWVVFSASSCFFLYVPLEAPLQHYSRNK